jgi:peptidoglycan hydrolase CwlO-like protein
MFSVARVIAFLTGPAGRMLLLVLAFVGWTVYQRHDATMDCEAEQLKQDLLESQRQLEKSNKIAKDARERADQTEVEMAETERLFDELKNEIENRACRIDDDLRERLLRIK